MKRKERLQLVIDCLQKRSETDADILSHKDMAKKLLEELDEDYCPRTKTWLRVMGFETLGDVRNALNMIGLGN